MFKVEERGDLFAAKATKADSRPTKADWGAGWLPGGCCKVSLVVGIHAKAAWGATEAAWKPVEAPQTRRKGHHWNRSERWKLKFWLYFDLWLNSHVLNESWKVLNSRVMCQKNSRLLLYLLCKLALLQGVLVSQVWVSLLSVLQASVFTCFSVACLTVWVPEVASIIIDFVSICDHLCPFLFFCVHIICPSERIVGAVSHIAVSFSCSSYSNKDFLFPQFRFWRNNSLSQTITGDNYAYYPFFSYASSSTLYTTASRLFTVSD